MVNKSAGVVIGVLLLIVLVLVGFIVYSAVVRPAFTGYAVDNYRQGAQDVIFTIMEQASTCQPIPLTAGNQTINLIAIECPQIQQLLQQ